MKNIITSLFIVVFFALSVSAQQNAAGKKDSCGLKEISFPCPKNLKINRTVSSENVFLMSSDERYKYHVFLISSGGKAMDAQTADKAIKELMPKLYPNEPQEYKWKNYKSSYKEALSKYELSSAGTLGFNNSHQIVIKYRRFKFNKQDFLLGYVYETLRGSGERYERFFLGATGGDNAGACQDLVDILFSITKEPKRKDIEFACSPPPPA